MTSPTEPPTDIEAQTWTGAPADAGRPIGADARIDARGPGTRHRDRTHASTTERHTTNAALAHAQ